MSNRSKFSSLYHEWEDNIDSIFSLCDKIEAAEKRNDTVSSDGLTKLMLKRRSRAIELDLLIHEKTGMASCFVENNTFENGKGENQ